jgi:flagellar protein FliS
MNAMSRNALNAYSQVGVETGVAAASPHKLIAMLYEGALLSIASAKVHMQRKEVAKKGEAISKAIAIIDEGLKASLDEKVGGDLAQNLKALYSYMCQRLLVANLKNETEPLEEVAHLLVDLKGAWDAIGKQQETAAVPQQQPEQAPNRASLSYGKA